MRKGGFLALLGAMVVMVISSCSAPVPVNISASGVSLNRSGIGLIVGESKTLTATVLPSNATDKGVTWTSDDDSIASVDKNGVVTGQGEGSTTITATTDDGGYTAICGALVGVFHASQVRFKLAVINLKVRDEYQLAWEVLPEYASDKDVSWTSSDTTIVDFINDSPGKIYAKAAGTATITVTTADGGKTDSCTIVVTP